MGYSDSGIWVVVCQKFLFVAKKCVALFCDNRIISKVKWVKLRNKLMIKSSKESNKFSSNFCLVTIKVFNEERVI